MKRHLPFALICAFLCALTISCRTQTTANVHDVYCGSKLEFSKSQTNESIEDQMKWSRQLYSQADLFLEFQGEKFERLKPSGSDGKSVFGTLAQIIPGTNDCGRSLAVVRLNDGYLVCTNCRTIEEDALDFHDYLMAQGFRRVVMVDTLDAMEFEMFPNGWPSRAEVEEKKQQTLQSK